MSRRWVLVAWAGLLVCTALSLVGLGLLLAAGAPLSVEPAEADLFDGLATVLLLSVPAVGTLLATRRPEHPIGWLLIGGAVAFHLERFGGTYVNLSLSRGDDPLPATELVALVADSFWIPGLLLGTILVLLLFPSGTFASRRWRVVGLTTAALMLLTVPATLFAPEELYFIPERMNPLGVAALAPVTTGLRIVTAAVGAVVLIAAIVSLVRRFRRAVGDERLQLRWFAYASGLFALSIPVAMTLEHTAVGSVLFEILSAVPALAIAVAVLKYRLYDIDVVISNTVVFAGLAGFITAIYVGIVVGVGSLLGAGDEPNLALSIVATAVVAVAFQPVRERLTRMANRLVFGHRATPYEVLSTFAGHLTDAATPQRNLERMAKLVADGTGAERVLVWMRVGERVRAVAVWPEVLLLDPVGDRHLSGQATFGDFDHVERVSHDSQLLGAITLTEPRGEALNHTEQELLRDLAGQAALVLRNLRLTEELRERIDQLHRSRERIVQAQDAERRRLEQDLNDGAQHRLTGLTRAIRETTAYARQEGAEQAASLLAQVADEGADAIRTIRDLAHGIYPPLLAAEGVAAAITAAAERAPVAVTVHADGIGRYSQDIEAAVYFCVLEAITNAAKYAEPSQVVVRLTHSDGQLTFEVSDDGTGFDPATTPTGHGITNMTDRLDALEGHLDIISEPGRGTRIEGRVPVVPDPAEVAL